MAFSKITAFAALVSFVALFAAMSEAPAQNLTYKNYPRTAAEAPTTDFAWSSTAWPEYLDPDFPPAVTPGGRDEQIFVKLRDDTALRCQLAYDMVATYDSGTIGTRIDVDGIWGFDEGHYRPVMQWTADFWAIDFIGVPAGPHRIKVLVRGVPGVFYRTSAVLQCFENMLGVPQ